LDQKQTLLAQTLPALQENDHVGGGMDGAEYG
jgi:hypothetical protein